MAGLVPDDIPDDQGCAARDSVGLQTLELHTEKALISKRVRRTLVRATRRTVTREEPVSAELSHEQVIIERVAVGRSVDAVPPIRQEGDVTIVPVVEEEVVLVRRLVLKEEIHLRRVRTVTTHAQTVLVRTQHVDVTRVELDD